MFDVELPLIAKMLSYIFGWILPIVYSIVYNVIHKTSHIVYSYKITICNYTYYVTYVLYMYCLSLPEVKMTNSLFLELFF